MDIYIVGELIHGEHECTLEPDYLKFANSDVYSQIVISESAMTCAMNQMAHSPIGYIHLNQEKANALLKKDNVDFDTSYFADFFPIFEKRLGPNKPFKIELDFKNINVLLGQYDTDLIFEYTLGIKFKLDALGAKELLYDEFRMITSMDMEAENESLFIKLLVNKIDTDAKYAAKEMPLRNSIDMSVSEYREFLASFSYSMNYLKGYLNEQVLEAGITFPFRFNEFDSKLEFLEKQMHILLEVNDMAYMFFDDEFLTE
uniref:Uncharacterized protein n=1 Tax=Strombidium rassoulzadegani TaxID=1082188 RepID=A0A7S3CT16_9SPIT|mmetsp:Transcript_7036/g.11833  ORF Transcript_7036/g.11833 Transcript_7036/m.11833 type:complete len:258 (+) Transcript_7036:822-1595(+)